jgi:transcriptional regulator with XRE-family HTH domain
LTYSTPGERIAAIRERRDLTQLELARLARISVSTVSKAERGEITPRLVTLHKMAKVLRVTTSALTDPERPEPAEAVPAEKWDDVRDALYRPPPPGDGEPPTEAGVLAVIGSLTAPGGPLAVNRYGRVHAVLPGLIRDAAALGEDGRTAQARAYNLTAWLLTMTRQWDDAAVAARLALDAAADLADEGAAVSTALWLMLRQGQIAPAGALAQEWAGDHQPSMLRSPPSHLAAFGKVMLYAVNAAVRDNQPGEAEDALRRARAAATLIGREVALDLSTTRTFGPASVEMIAAENAAIQERPERVIAVTERIPRGGLLHAQSASRLRSGLDVANARVMLKQGEAAMDELDSIRAEAPEWLREQRYARDIVGNLKGLWKRRRPDRFQLLADAVQLPY